MLICFDGSSALADAVWTTQAAVAGFIKTGSRKSPSAAALARTLVDGWTGPPSQLENSWSQGVALQHRPSDVGIAGQAGAAFLSAQHDLNVAVAIGVARTTISVGR